MKALPYILYAAALTYIVYRVVKHELENEPTPHVKSDLVEYDEVTGRFYDSMTHEEVDPSEVMGVQ